MTAAATRGRMAAIALWLVFLAGCALVISRTHFTTDLSAFLPRTPTPEQQLLKDQITEGLASRLVLVGIEGADAPTRARLSRQLAQQLRADPAFASVSNGEPVNTARDRDFLLANRYVLSPAVTPERFSEAGLHAALGESIDLLASPAGLMAKALLPRDPTGEMLQLLGQFNAGSQPRQLDGAWASRDGRRALMLLQTRAAGSDTDAQQQAMAAVRKAFDAAAGQSGASLVMTGPGVFSVTSREAIQSQVSLLSMISVALIAGLLLLVYRSASALVLGFLPVITGALAGIAAVSLGFGSVHGITLGFGTALIGEAVDYSIYLFVQSEDSGADPQHWVRRFWPTVRLGVLTSVAGFASLLLSGFPGLAQLGLYSIAGLITAAAVTRYVLPHLLPAGFRIHDVSAIGRVLQALAGRGPAAGRLRRPGRPPCQPVQRQDLLAEPGVTSRCGARRKPARRHGRAGCALCGGGLRRQPGSGAAKRRAGVRRAPGAGRARPDRRLRQPQPLPSQPGRAKRPPGQPAAARTAAAAAGPSGAGPAGARGNLRAFSGRRRRGPRPAPVAAGRP